MKRRPLKWYSGTGLVRGAYCLRRTVAGATFAIVWPSAFPWVAGRLPEYARGPEKGRAGRAAAIAALVKRGDLTPDEAAAIVDPEDA